MTFTANQIAALTGGTVVGDGNAQVSGFAKIEEATSTDISFIANPKYEHFIATTQAAIVIVSNDFAPQGECRATLIRVPNPYATLAQLMDFAAIATTPSPTGVEQPAYIAEGVDVPEGAYVGAFAYVGKGVSLGKNVKIYPQAYVGANVTIGEDTIIYTGAKIYHGCRIGARCIIHAGAVIGADGFGFAPDEQGKYHKIPQIGIVEIADDVEIGANTTIDRATMGATIIEEGVKLDNLIQAAHNTRIGHDTVIAAQAGIAGSAQVGANCAIGGQVGIAGHIKVGNRVQIGAQSGIPNSVADGSRLIGYPAMEFGEFARLAVYNKRLGELFSRVRVLEKKNK